MNSDNKRVGSTAAGRLGERAAAEYLVSLGYKILHMNFRASHLEIDIIAENDERIIFVEVKSRTLSDRNQSRFGRPAAAVTKAKQQRLLAAAGEYLRQRITEKAESCNNTSSSEAISETPQGPHHKRIRIDVIEVYFSPRDMSGIAGCFDSDVVKINHIENAVMAR